MKWSFISLLVILLSFSTATPALAELSPADIEKNVRKADVLSPNVQVRGITKGPEVILSVYVADSVPDTDLKIDTVMLAKEFFSIDSKLTRTTINFYDPLKPQSYRSVSVRSTDVKPAMPDTLLRSSPFTIRTIGTSRRASIVRNGSGGEILLQRSKSQTPEQAYFEGLHLQRSHAVSAK